MTKDFCVTANGPAATRWFSFVLASHSEVYVTHGSYPLDSVIEGSYDDEKAMLQAPINSDAVTRGRLAERFIKTTPLDELYDEFRTRFPNYTTYGCVHSFVLHELFNKPELYNLNLTLRNLIRNPINYIASHTKLVVDAQSFSEELHEHYSRFYEKQFLTDYPQFLQHFPEFDTDNIELIGHVLSCYTIKRQQADLNQFDGKVDNILMEKLVSDVDYLQDACEKVTGLSYSVEQLTPFITGGALNSHRKKGPSSAQTTYASWSPLQKSIFNYLLDEKDLMIYQANGYDLSFVEREPCNA
ncbi:hypothetical protein [Marinomonas atlantica]|uniref:hypothetical protein n=1 Tax=Marinomonas atlantica TaxID=1806668 RepID=UPI000836C507|nr:hypothetical protein [Marinomonas atlantica]